ncbi:glycosyltransferase family 2 protein [Endothiovibrio diazotrophicus]
MKLSVVIPVYNEIATIHRILPLVVAALPGVEKELILVDDCSGDGTREWLREHLKPLAGRYRELRGAADGIAATEAAADQAGASLKVLFHEENRGKGAALRTGFAAAGGEVIVVQDADLEYDPADWGRMWPLIAEHRLADVVYGSRFYGRPHRSLQFHHLMANRLLSLLFSVLYNQALSDMEVCYKMFTREVLESLSLSADDFGFEVQFSAQVALARRWRIYEVGITYYGRDYHEGKKINWRDGVKALGYLLKYRF